MELSVSQLRQFVRDVRASLNPASASPKFVMYYELLEAFKQPGCPVCARLEEGSRRAMDEILYEQVTDPVTLARAVESRGFCNWHTWMLPRIQNSPLGVALIYQHLLTNALGHLKAVRPHRTPRGSWRHLWERSTRKGLELSSLVHWWTTRKGCSLCVRTHQSEREHLKAILAFLGEADFAEGFAHSAGLCLPHLCHAAAISPDHANLPALLSAHEARWLELAAELGEFIRKNDYRFAMEVMGQEGTSWRQRARNLRRAPGRLRPRCQKRTSERRSRRRSRLAAHPGPVAVG